MVKHSELLATKAVLEKNVYQLQSAAEEDRQMRAMDHNNLKDSESERLTNKYLLNGILEVRNL
jgi:hypothetical protein